MKKNNERSNVESTFGSIKKKLGDSLKSKNHTAQVNELYCKFIAYNITMLIRAMYLHDVEIDFNEYKVVETEKTILFKEEDM